MCKRDLQYFKKCLASRGEVTVFDKSTNQTTTYVNHNGKLVMHSAAGKLEGMDAAVSFLSSNSNPSVEMKVTKEGETCINTEFLGYLNQAEESYKAGL